MLVKLALLQLCCHNGTTYWDVNRQHLSILDDDSAVDDVEVHLARPSEHQCLHQVMMSTYAHTPKVLPKADGTLPCCSLS